MQDKEGERYQVAYLKGKYGSHPHVVDTKDDGRRIVSFGEIEGLHGGSQIFLDPEEAERAAQQLNAGENPKNIRILSGYKDD